MNKFFGGVMAALLLSVAGVSCSDDDISGTGVNEATWSNEIVANIEGENLEYSFYAAGHWVARSNADWCVVTTPNGIAGESLLRLKVARNLKNEARETNVTVTVTGAEKPIVLVVKQDIGFSEQGDGKYRELNEWTANYMKEYYLWNRPIQNLSLDYSISYDKFLTSILDGVAAQGDVNHDDGHWKGEKRMYYYSNIRSNAPTRVVGEESIGSGIYHMSATMLGESYIGFAVSAVAPGTPAAKAGIVRGDFITAVDGVSVTQDNYKNLGPKVYAGGVKVALNSVTWINGGSTPVVKPKEEVQLDSAPFIDPAIYMSKVIEYKESGKKVGYLLYMGFNVAFDEDLMKAFDEFRANNVTDLILDLRYNNGGDVLSSTVLGTLIVGDAYKGQVYSHITCNEDRTANGAGGDYKIGVKETVERVYQPIEDALQHSLNFKRVYVICTESTASASEMVINGLRGLDVEVNLIGQRTNGKNVGMEGVGCKFHGYDFLLYPITFYVENAKGFKDYANGFVPDVEMDDSSIYPGEFGTMEDQLSYVALVWAEKGEKPQFEKTRSGFGRGVNVIEELTEERTIKHMGGAVIRPKTEN